MNEKELRQRLHDLAEEAEGDASVGEGARLQAHKMPGMDPHTAGEFRLRRARQLYWEAARVAAQLEDAGEGYEDAGRPTDPLGRLELVREVVATNVGGVGPSFRHDVASLSAGDAAGDA